MVEHAGLRLFTELGIGVSEGREFSQHLGTGLTDHRGLIEMPVLTKLFDDIGGYEFWMAESATAIQSRLSMSMIDRLDVHDVVVASGGVRMSSGIYGVTDVELTVSDCAVCTGTGRNVRVGRAEVSSGSLSMIPAPVAPSAPAVPPLPTDLSGRQIVERLVSGELPLGPFPDLFNVSLDAMDGDEVAMSAVTEGWMANPLGTMHGGVISALVGQAVSYAGQLHTAPGADYLLTEFSVAFLRSPTVDGRTVTVRAKPIKLGRRLITVEASMFDGDQLLAHGVADIRMDLPAGR